MNYLKVLAILSLLFIFCGSVYGAGEADSPDINGVNAVIDDTITVENPMINLSQAITVRKLLLEIILFGMFRLGKVLL